VSEVVKINVPGELTGTVAPCSFGPARLRQSGFWEIDAISGDPGGEFGTFPFGPLIEALAEQGFPSTRDQFVAHLGFVASVGNQADGISGLVRVLGPGLLPVDVLPPIEPSFGAAINLPVFNGGGLRINAEINPPQPLTWELYLNMIDLVTVESKIRAACCSRYPAVELPGPIPDGPGGLG